MDVAVAHKLGREAMRDSVSRLARSGAAMPAVGLAIRRGMMSLSPASPIRRRLIRTSSIDAMSAVANGDLEIWVTYYAEDAVHEWSEGWVSLGMPRRAEGREAITAAMAHWDTVWESWEMVPEYTIDRGEMLVQLQRLSGTSAAAGASVEVEQAAAIDLHEGEVARERDYNDWDSGLRAAGIDSSVREVLEDMGDRDWITIPSGLVGPIPAEARSARAG